LQEVKIMQDLKITLKKSTIGSKPQHRKTVEALGLRKLNQTVVKKDNPAIRGMIDSVRHLIEVN
jgi:large subunit ribosomal protein L30